MLENDGHMAQSTAHVADQRAREVDQALRHAAMRHELAGEIEERDREQQELVRPGAICCATTMKGRSHFHTR